MVWRGPPAYSNLVRFLGIIDGTRWDEVTLGRSERPGLAGVRCDRSPTERRRGGEYLYIDPVTGYIVHQRAGKRRRYSTYDCDYPHAHVQAHFAFESGPPRTLAEVNSNVGTMLPDVQENNPQKGKQTAQAGKSSGTNQKETQPGPVTPSAQVRAVFNPGRTAIC